MSWTIREHQQEPDRLAHLLYWHELITPDVVRQKDGSLLSVIAYRGPDMESADLRELHTLTQRVHGLLKPFGAGWGVHIETRRALALPYPVSTWSQPTAALVDEERRAQLGMPGTHFETIGHLTFTFHPPSTTSSWWQNLWWENVPENHASENVVAQFQEDIRRLYQALHSILHEAVLLTNTALMTYLKSTVSLTTQQVRVPSPTWHLDISLTDMPLLPGAVPQLGDYWLRLITIKNDTEGSGYPETSYPGILDVLYDLPLEYRYVIRWLPMDRPTADKKLRFIERVLRGGAKSIATRTAEKATGTPAEVVEISAINMAQQASEARAMLNQGILTFGYLTQTIVVWDTDFSIAEEKRLLVEHALQSQGFITACEKLNSMEAWLGAIPGDCYHNVREPLLHSLNLVHLMPTTSVWSGPTAVPHLQGPPLLVGTGKGETPFRITTHEGDVGDHFGLGPKGSGKSTLLAMMALQWDRYTNARVAAFDNGGSLKCATLAMEGNWVELRPRSSKPLQPFTHIHKEEECAWALEWTLDLLEAEHIVGTSEVKREIWEALKSLADMSPHYRTLSGLCGLLQHPQLREALYPYTVDGPYGALFDGDEDWLHIGRWTCFEMGTLLNDFPRIVPFAAKILLRRVERSLDGDPTLIPIDECYTYLQYPSFSQRFLIYLKTLRRKNVSLGFWTQNPLDIKNSPIGAEIIQACPTRIFCPNPHATEPDTMAIYAGFGLTERQCELIASSVPKRDYYYQGQQGTRLFRLDLGEVALAFCGRSRLQDLQRIDYINETRTEPFAVAWLRDQGLTEMAETLLTSYEKDNTDDSKPLVESVFGTPASMAL